VFILADDLGIECLSGYGGTSHQTPNIDRLAAQGMRFSNCFSNPTCSPSRATLLTGRYSFHHGVTRVIWHETKHKDLYLHTDQPSFARQLQSVGYTTAIAGKWQLAFLHQRNTINAFGFDTYQCWQIYDENNEKTRRFHEPHFNRDGRIIHDQIEDRYGPDVNVEFLSDFIKHNAEENKPFLAYYTCLLPHYPWVPTPDSEDREYVLDDNAGKGDPKYFPDMVRYLDKCVGRLLKAIDEAGVADNTVVIFAADNGTDRDLVNAWGPDKLIPGGKGTMTDRGTHVPFIVRWPGKVKAGSICEDLIDFSDFLPTICGLAGAPLPDQPIHGHSFIPQLLGQPGEPRTWVHVQDKQQRHLRTKSYILNNRGAIRPVVELWRDPGKAYKGELPAEVQAASRSLQAVFNQLGK
jgi:arylsulfatase A